MAEARSELEPLTREHAAYVQRSLTAWYRANRRDLPWRGADAYCVWVSEIMLQQTQVATVIPYYERFIQRFPTAAALASASLDEVLKYWSGLGYYARARNLHRAASIIMNQHAGIVPNSLNEVLKLPGVGSYTAGAILSIAYDQRYSAVDANVVRVICRMFGICGDPKSSQTQRDIRLAAEQLVPTSGPGEFNQALMELGALLCDPADPQCEECPLVAACDAGNSPDPTRLPEYAAAKTVTNMVHSCLVMHNDADELLIVQRPPHGLWGGLWEFPRVVCIAGETPENAARRASREVTGIEMQGLSPLTVIKHTVTRFRITLHAFMASTAVNREMYDKSNSPYPPAGTHSSTDALRWVPAAKLADYAFSSPQTLVRNALRSQDIVYGRL